jgi:hypothetical protein
MSGRRTDLIETRHIFAGAGEIICIIIIISTRGHVLLLLLLLLLLLQTLKYFKIF